VTLSLSSRRVGDITVLTCVGRLIEGEGCAVLQQQLQELLPLRPWILLHLGDVDFIDSSGLGLLVRYLARARHARGNVKVCAPSQRLREALKVTHLDRVIDCYESEADAITAFYDRTKTGAVETTQADILCVANSPDVLAYVRELLTQAGYGVLAAGNLPDALVLLSATRPNLVIIDAQLWAMRGTRTADTFHKLADSVRLVELPADFSAQDASEAGRLLLDRVRAAGGGTAKV